MTFLLSPYPQVACRLWGRVVSVLRKFRRTFENFVHKKNSTSKNEIFFGWKGYWETLNFWRGNGLEYKNFELFLKFIGFVRIF